MEKFQFNEQRIMVSFNKSCPLVSNNRTLSVISVLKKYAKILWDIYSECIEKKNNLYDSGEFAFQFYELKCTIKEIQASNITFNWSQLCVSWAVYEPVFELHESINGTFPKILDTSEFKCIKKDVSDGTLYGLDLLNSLKENGTYYHPNMTHTNSDFIEIHILGM